MKNLILKATCAFLILLLGIGQSKSQTLYGITNTGFYTVYLSKLDIQTGSVTAISPGIILRTINPVLSAIDPIHRRFFVTSHLTNGGDSLFSIDLTTGLIANKTKVTLATTYFNQVIEYNCKDTTLYTIAENRTDHKVFLSSINPSTGLQTIISPAPLGSTAGGGQSALDPVNRRFFYYGLSDTIISVDLTTGRRVSSAKLSLPGAYYMPSFEYNSEDQTLYAITNRASAGAYPVYLAKINPSTGSVTIISHHSVANRMGGFQSGLDPVNSLFFFMADDDSLCALSLGSGNVIYKNKILHNPSSYLNLFMGFEKPCTQLSAGMEGRLNQRLTQLFPNPFSITTIIKLEQDCNDAKLSVYNLAGEKVNELTNINGQEIKLSRNNLPAGMYFIRLTEDNIVIGFEKIIISD